MINTKLYKSRPILNLDLDLLRTFVAVADLNTFAAAAAAVCRTQSAVSQQMQRCSGTAGGFFSIRHRAHPYALQRAFRPPRPQ
ncbi:LysR family transcriptional regulator [Klebsiella pneumoniae]|uniref:LysR family transcriptional regulator n=1 Tax=Klebsiella pneumoniae TaxID=573 RepID=UPI0039871925